MNKQQMNQRKLVQAFKTFFDKSVQPHIKNNDSIMSDWRSFQSMISSQPLDTSQLDSYIQRNSKGYSQIKRSGQAFQKHQSGIIPMSNSSQGITYPKKSLISYLQSFQSVLVKNQQRLQQLSKKDQSSNLNGSNKRNY